MLLEAHVGQLNITRCNKTTIQNKNITIYCLPYRSAKTSHTTAFVNVFLFIILATGQHVKNIWQATMCPFPWYLNTVYLHIYFLHQCNVKRKHWIFLQALWTLLHLTYLVLIMFPDSV